MRIHRRTLEQVAAHIDAWLESSGDFVFDVELSEFGLTINGEESE